MEKTPEVTPQPPGQPSVPTPPAFPWSLVRSCVLVMLLVTLVYHQFPALRQPVTAIFDTRPVKRVLFIGNSHTFHHNVPFMMADIADSANSPVRFAVTVHGIGGARLRDHWNNPEVQELLHQPWDVIVLQGASNETFYPQTAATFQDYGRRLVSAARKTGAQVALYVTWPYADSYGDVQQDPSLRDRMFSASQSQYWELAAATGAKRVNVGERWQTVRNSTAIPLYEDGNHATIQGSYLAALVFYRFLGQSTAEATTGSAAVPGLAQVRYVPPGVTVEQAQTLIRYAGQ
jgi:hypothetical protein